MKESGRRRRVVLLVPTLALAQKTSFDYDKSADFSNFKTYALKDGMEAGDPLIDQRIVAAIEVMWRGMGVTEVTQAMAENRDRNITAAVTILQNVPPKKNA